MKPIANPWGSFEFSGSEDLGFRGLSSGVRSSGFRGLGFSVRLVKVDHPEALAKLSTGHCN